MPTNTNLSQATTQFATILLREMWVKKGHILMFIIGFIVGVAKERDNGIHMMAVILVIAFLTVVLKQLATAGEHDKKK